jgi:hypothetical protein
VINSQAQLRDLLEPLVTNLKDGGTHTMLPLFCEELGLPAVDGSIRLYIRLFIAFLDVTAF